MQLKTKKFLIIMTIVSFLIIGESLTASAKQSQIDYEATPDLFHIGDFELNITVSETDFSPITFTVKESAFVNLTIESLDIGHTFEITEYGIYEEILPLEKIVVEFEANKLGTFTYSSINCSETGTMEVLDPYVPNLPRHDEVGILFDFKHNTDTTATQKKFSGLVNWTEDSNFDLRMNIDEFITEDLLVGVDVLIVLEPEVNFSSPEIDVVLSYVRNGGGLLFAGSNRSVFNKNFHEITQPFGFKFTNTTASYINSTDLIDPIGETNTIDSFFISEFVDHPIISENQYVPLTDDVVTNINYIGPVLELNTTWAEDSLNSTEDVSLLGELIDSYALVSGNETIFADANGNSIVDINETIGEENTLIAAAETTANGRVLGFGSADILNKTLMGRYPANSVFVHRAIQWLAKMYAILETQEYQLNTFEVRQGNIIDVSLEIYAQNNTPLEGINITLNVLRTSKVEYTIYLDAINETNFNGSIDTLGIKIGTVYANAIAHKRGYGYNSTRDYYFNILPPAAKILDFPIPYIITFVLSSLIGIAALSFFFVRVLRIPKEAEIAEGEDKDKESEEEEEDLDEYETEETELDDYEIEEEATE
ncbi:MAG: hypothetical protein EAX90_00915 [Candidatus Heimdallarchaeota archaeon]|nr:hypothetical protein [Candidatus Heimdallarchaeota archaeon]